MYSYVAFDVSLVLKAGDKEIVRLKKLKVQPSEMEKIVVKKDDLNGVTGDLTLSVEGI